MEELTDLYKTAFGNHEENIPIGRPRYGREDNIKTDLKIIKCEDS
jgi:hypothetical protein